MLRPWGRRLPAECETAAGRPSVATLKEWGRGPRGQRWSETGRAGLSRRRVGRRSGQDCGFSETEPLEVNTRLRV